MRKFLPKSITGFTLVELVVVVGILGLLTVILIATLNPIAQFQKALDAQRKHDLMEVRNALDNYYNDNNCYPKMTAADFPFGQEWADQDTVYMKLVPQDPQPYCSGGKCYYYYYQTDTRSEQDGGTNCPQWNILYARLADNNDVPAGQDCSRTILNACSNQLKNSNFGVNPNYKFCVISGKLDCSAIENNSPLNESAPPPVTTSTTTTTTAPPPPPTSNCLCAADLQHPFSYAPGFALTGNPAKCNSVTSGAIYCDSGCSNLPTICN